MAWREQLQPASFRGVPFSVEGGDREFGKRLAVHEFPFRDEPLVEELGAAARRISVDAFVLGSDYTARRDALEAALRQKGPGTLVLPTRGALQAVFETGAVRESAAYGGMATFRLTFVETDQASAGTAPLADTGVAVDDKAAAVQDAADQEFASGFDVAGYAAYVADQAESLVGGAVDAVQQAAAPLTATGDALYGMSRRLTALRTDVSGLVKGPADLALSLRGAIGSIRGLTGAPGDAFTALKTLLGFKASAPAAPAATLSRLQQVENSRQVEQLVRRHAAAEAARAVAEVQFGSYQDAVAVRDDLAATLDDLAVEAADAGEDTVFQALEELRLAVVRDVTDRGGSLARLYQHTPPATVPALVLAQRLYGDALRADEIVARNRVRRPGFVPGGRPIEVLSDG